MDPIALQALAVIGAIVVALLVFGGLVLLGAMIVRWLRLPQDLPDGARYSPPAPPLSTTRDRAAAHATAELQARRRALFIRAQALAGKGDEAIRDLPLEPAALDRADAALRQLEA